MTVKYQISNYRISWMLYKNMQTSCKKKIFKSAQDFLRILLQLIYMCALFKLCKKYSFIKCTNFCLILKFYWIGQIICKQLDLQLILTIQWQGVPASSTGESWQYWEWNGAGGHCVFQSVFGCFAPHPAKDTG